MLKIIAADLHFELTTKTINVDSGTVPKYILIFSDNVAAHIYKSGIIKSVSVMDTQVIRTLGGTFVSIEPDYDTGGYITANPTQQQLNQFKEALRRLDCLRTCALGGDTISISRTQHFEYEEEDPADDEVIDFFRSFKSASELETIGCELNSHLGIVDVIHPAIGDIDYLAFSFSQGCDGNCTKCNFQHDRTLVPRTEHELCAQIDFYKKIFPTKELAHFSIFAGNHRGLGIDFELFTEQVDRLKDQGRMRAKNIFAFCTAEDIIRLHKRYGIEDFGLKVRQMGLHVNLGVESGSSAGLQEYGKTVSLGSTRKALAILKDTGISYSVNIIAGVEWENHVKDTLQFFRDIYGPDDNKPTVYSSEFMDEHGKANNELATEQYEVFRNSLNDIGIDVFKYTFIPFNGGRVERF